MKKTQFKGVAMLLITAFIWGVAFVAQSVGMESVGAFTFGGIRTLLGALVLLPFLIVKIKKSKSISTQDLEAKRAANKKELHCGLILGVVFFIAGNLQQFAFYYSSPGKIAFITALYMFFVPLIGLIFRKKVSLITWISVFVGFIGLYFLCITKNDVGAINKGDILAFLCSIFFAIHILMVEKFAADMDGIKLSCIQFTVSGVISCILMFIFEQPRIGAILDATVPILYSGVLSCGLAYTFQILGQKYTEATVASILMSMESVFAVVASAILLNEILSPRETLGCVIMFAAILLSQLSDVITSKFKKRSSI